VTLKAKLVLAQAPLAMALAFVGLVSGTVTTRLGAQSRLILADNYRSVLAAQRIKDALDHVDAQALMVVSGRARSVAAEPSARRSLERELAVQEGNITEPGETEATRAMRAAWNEYARALGYFDDAEGRPAHDAIYFGRLRPALERINAAADRILDINQDAMVHKSDRAARRAVELERLMVAVVFLGLTLGLLASTWLTTRLLRPLGVVAAAVRRFGDGDLGARAAVRGADEIASVAAEFNRMAERLERYRASSLGELLQAQQAAQAAIDSLPDPVLLLDPDGAPRGANAAANKLLAIDPERAPSEIYASADPAVRAMIDRLKAHVLAGKGAYVPKGFEEAIRIASPTEGERVLLPRATPIYGENGTVSGAAIVLQDSTRLFRFDELKNNLVATVAHEFRTPLTSLRMAIHLCTEHVVGPLTPKQEELLFAAREDCERLQVIVDELLNLSRIESGQIDLHKRRIEPETLIGLAVEVHRAAAAQAEVRIETEVPPGLPDVFVDPDRLQLVFTNLVTNAIRFAPKDSAIVVRARPEAGRTGARDHRLAEAEAVRFEVSDGGPGVPVEHQAALFEKFFRVPGSPAGGSGLGLFIAKGLVQAHGGQIGIDSQPGQGATFWFTVPCAPPPAVS
jgi:NtrC-family two-component system sensor histidine kinase KinB